MNEIQEFLDDKDTSKYDKQLELVLHALKANSVRVERDRDDVKGLVERQGEVGLLSLCLSLSFLVFWLLL